MELKKTISKTTKKKKDPGLTKFKRFIYSRTPDSIKKRKLYAEKPSVKERRKELNALRRHLCSILITMLKNGKFYNSEGLIYDIIGNKPVLPSKKIFFEIDSSKNIIEFPYTTEEEVLNSPPKKLESETDIKFKELLKAFKEDNPDAIQLLKKKKITIEKESDDLDETVKFIKENYAGDINEILGEYYSNSSDDGDD